MGMFNNTPTLSYVAWKNLIITYNNTMYTVQNSKSNKKYIYWESALPNVLTDTNEKKPNVVGRYLIAFNDRGTYTLVPYDDIVVSFDGDSPDLMSEKMYGIYKKTSEFDSKFVSFETDINGLRQVVGDSTSPKPGTILNRTSELEQRVDGIDLSVSNATKEFNDDKEMNTLRDSVNKSIIGLNSALGVFQSKMSDYYLDSTISNEEKINIDEEIYILESEKLKVITETDKVIVIMESENETESVNNLNSAKTKLETEISNLKTLINTSVIDDIIVPSEITLIIDAFGKCNTSINLLKNTIDGCILLGSGGSIIDELSKISIKSNEISSEVSKKVGEDEVISSINQTAESIKINADKLELIGLVTISDLSGEGTTIINGSNITGGIIKGTQLQTYSNDSSKGVRIQSESIQLNDTNLFFDVDGKFKIEAINNIGISSRNDIYVMPRINVDGTMTYDGYLNVGGHCKAVSLTANETMKLYNTSLYSPYAGSNFNCDVLKLGGINFGAVSPSSVHLVTTGGARANLYANFFGTINGVTVSSVTDEPSLQEQLLQEDFTTLDKETNSIFVNLNDATISLYERNKSLEKENEILKQTQIEQDEVTINNAYQIALIKLP